MDENHTIVTLKERPDLEDAINMLHNRGWTKFMRKDPIAAKYWESLLSCFPGLQYILLNEKSEPIACGNSIPFKWDGNKDDLPKGWDAVFEKGILEGRGSITPDTLSALAIVILPEYRGKGLSGLMIKEMKRLAKINNLTKMVAPVRPSLKSNYPLTPMKEYVSWLREDGTPFDPWIRIHYKTGASILKVAEKSMEISGTVKEWEEWTGMKFPASGSYIIKDGLVPLTVDKLADKGVYIEPNVWLRHDIK